MHKITHQPSDQTDCAFHKQTNCAPQSTLIRGNTHTYTHTNTHTNAGPLYRTEPEINVNRVVEIFPFLLQTVSKKSHETDISFFLLGPQFTSRTNTHTHTFADNIKRAPETKKLAHRIGAHIRVHFDCLDENVT